MKILPQPDTKGTVSVEEAIAKRRSVRSFTNAALTDTEISQLLWAAQGITDKASGHRAVPSAGATYPLETYLATTEGLFRYLPEKHALEQISAKDVRSDLAKAALGQRFIKSAPATIIFAAVPTRTTGRYGERGLRYIYMEAGHAAENVHLQVAALGLGSVPVGAFSDDEVAKVLNLPKDEKPLYLIPVGR